ncbi:MAG: hypothetical protein B6I35_04145 [Anaerolineaceae bacterium 4572_32.2]|nr:MAG: hypothetical protein B6I35_04145 [Anaerolineaceae bacterium 4572_32.2]
MNRTLLTYATHALSHCHCSAPDRLLVHSPGCATFPAPDSVTADTGRDRVLPTDDPWRLPPGHSIWAWLGVAFLDRRSLEHPVCSIGVATSRPDTAYARLSRLATISPSELSGGRLGADRYWRPVPGTVRGLPDRVARITARWALVDSDRGTSHHARRHWRILLWAGVGTAQVGSYAKILIAILAPLGDLAVSMIKRQVGAKDSGVIIPGHGGALDRVDSILWAAAIGYYYVQMFASQ